MGNSAYGIIGYGVLCEEGQKFPWDDEKYNGDIEEWWRDENGYIPLYQPYDEDGNYAPGWNRDDPRLEEYYHHQDLWLLDHPPPISLENYYSFDFPMWALVIPTSVLACKRGDFTSFNPANLTVSPEQIRSLKHVLEKYNISHKGEPGWFLIGYEG